MFRIFYENLVEEYFMKILLDSLFVLFQIGNSKYEYVFEQKNYFVYFPKCHSSDL